MPWSRSIGGMTPVQGESEVVKVDRRGRMHISRERRQRLLEEFDQSGLSAPQFAKVAGLKYQTLASWLQRRREASELSPAGGSLAKGSTIQWLEATVASARTQPSAEVCKLGVRLPSGAVVEVSEAAQIPLAVAFVRAWEKALC